MITGVGLQGDSNGLDEATVKEDDGTDETEELTEAGSKRYRSLAVVNFLSIDQPGLQYAASLLGRSMSRRTAKAEARLKRVARYFLAHPRFARTYCRGVASEVLDLVVWSDSDWAGCRASRQRWYPRDRRRDREVVVESSGVNRFVQRRGCRQQSCHGGLGAKSLPRDLGWKALLALNIDAEAARAIASRQGVGKIWHLEVWLQDVVRIGIICLSC